MYVVGSERLQSYWQRHPGAAAQLGALFALLEEGAWSSRGALLKALGEIAAAKEDAIAITLGDVRVTVKENCAAGVLLIDVVEKIA